MVRFFRTIYCFTIVLILLTGCEKQQTCQEQGLGKTYDFVTQWNEEISSLSVGSWALPVWQELEYGVKGQFVHSLDGASLNIKLSVVGACLSSLEIGAKRDRSIGMASLVSWVKLLKILSPEVTPDRRKKIFHDLGIDKPRLQAGGKATTESFVYSFFESEEGNVFSATPLTVTTK